MAGNAFLSAWQAAGQSVPDRLSAYAYYSAWEDGTVFTPNPSAPGAAVWAERLKQQYRLYRWTRLVWNPVPDLTDFWGSVIYPGVLLQRADIAPDTKSAFPLDPGIDPDLHDAIDQVLWWSGFGWQKYVIPYYAAIDGNVLLKLVDDLPNAKVYFRPVRACLVRDIDLSPSQDVLYSATEETITPATGEPYIYREEVSKTTFRTYRDGKPYDFSGDLHLGHTYPNDWGFVPACWVPFQPSGTAWAAPAIGPALPELLAINSLLSQLDDMVGRAANPIWTFITTSDVSPAFATGKQGATSDLDPSDGGRESVKAFKMKDGSVAKLDPSGDVAAISAHLETRLAWFNRHFPELSMWESLRERNVSGIAAEILHGDTRNKVLNIRPGMDRQVEKAIQMCITMAAVRYPSWGRTDSARAVFKGFDKTSYDKGLLKFTIAERPLVPVAPLTAREKADLAVVLKGLGLPAAYVYEQAGVPDAVITDQANAAVAPPPASGAFLTALASLVTVIPELNQPFLWKQILSVGGIPDVDKALAEIEKARAEADALPEPTVAVTPPEGPPL